MHSFQRQTIGDCLVLGAGRGGFTHICVGRGSTAGRMSGELAPSTDFEPGLSFSPRNMEGISLRQDLHIHSKSKKVCGTAFSVKKKLQKKCVNPGVNVSRQMRVNPDQ